MINIQQIKKKYDFEQSIKVVLDVSFWNKET